MQACRIKLDIEVDIEVDTEVDIAAPSGSMLKKCMYIGYREVVYSIQHTINRVVAYNMA